MSLAFANPALWPAALLAAAMPLLMHLFARARPPVRRFPSIEFLRRAHRHTVRVRRPRDGLLLALRTLAAASLAGAFLRPVLYAGRAWNAGRAPRSVVLLVDATASMAFGEGGRTRFAAACAEAAEILDGLRPGDRANLVWLRARPAAEFPEMGANAAFLRDALRRARGTLERGDAAAALALAAEQLREAPGPRELYLLSDFQAGTWQDAAAALPPEIEVTQVSVARGDAPNVAIADLRCEPPAPLRGEPATVFCQVVNHGPDPVRRTVALAAGARRESREVALPPGGSATAAFALPFAAAGASAVEAAIDPDRFPADDARALVIDVRERLRVAFRPGDPGLAAAWRRALAAFDWVEEVPDNPARPPDLLLLPRVPGPVERPAVPVLYAPAPGVAIPGWAAALGLAPGESPALSPRNTDAAGLRAPNPRDPLLRIFEEGAFGDPARARFHRWLPLREAPGAGAERVLDHADGTPALARSADGRQVLWNLPLDAADGDLAGLEEFVVLLGEILRQMPRATADASAAVEVGEPLRFRPADESAVRDVALRGPDGRARETRVELLPEGDSVAGPAADVPGLYAWTAQDRPLGHTAALFPAVESDLRALDRGAPAAARAGRAASGVEVRRLREGIPLWPGLLAAALGFALVEGVALFLLERRA